MSLEETHSSRISIQPLTSGETDPLTIGSFELHSRLILGSGRFDSFEIMRAAIDESHTSCVTLAVRRERLHDSSGRNIVDFLDHDRLILLPNTAGCYDAQTAVRCARLGRELLEGLENPGSRWVKLEVIGDSRSLLPDSLETLRATELLVEDGFEVLCYSNDDPIMAQKLKSAGAVSVMPAGSPIGSGRGIANRENLQLILEMLKADDPEYPVIVDAGLGTASDVAIAFELGADGVLLNSAVARAGDPVLMSSAMRDAASAGRRAFLAQRIPRSKYGSASSPDVGMFSDRKRDT